MFTGVDLAVDHGAEVVAPGLNGAGKTILLRLLFGIEELSMGEIILRHGLKFGCCAQEHGTLDDVASVCGNMVHAAPELDEAHLRNILG